MASRRTALGGAALLTALAVPGTAQAAPTVATSVPCVRYVDLDPSANANPLATLGVSTSGWPAGTPLTFTLDGRTVGSGAADATGAFNNQAGLFKPTAPKGNLQTKTLLVNGGQASVKFKVVRLTVDVPSKAKPSKRVKYRAFGFTPGKKLYLFVRRGNKTKGRFTLGKPKGACGTVTKKLRYMPLRHYKVGTYEFWYSQSRKYSESTRIFGYTLGITKTLR